MTLVFDNRTRLAGRPGLHAFVAGVSAYANLPTRDAPETGVGLGMRQLSSTALTARKICDWLIAHHDQLVVPLATCRLLASPTPDELRTEPQLANADACTLLNFLRTAGEWRRDAEGQRDNATFFYFAGHGIQRSGGDQVMLLDDFADGVGGLLRNAVDTLSLRDGLKPSASRPDVARTQFYFVDACRNLPEQITNFEALSTTSVFDVELGGAIRDDRRAPIFYASVPGDRAFAVRSQTFFSTALLQCLDGDAAEPPEEDGSNRWCVSYHSLSEMLGTCLGELNTELGTDQQWSANGFGPDVPICFLDGPPAVPISLQLSPLSAAQCAQVQLLDLDTDAPVWQSPLPVTPLPLLAHIPAGHYRIKASISPPTEGFVAPQPKRVQIKPRRALWKLDVQNGTW